MPADDIEKALYKDLKKVLCEYYKKHFSKLTELKGKNSKKGRKIRKGRREYTEDGGC